MAMPAVQVPFDAKAEACEELGAAALVVGRALRMKKARFWQAMDALLKACRKLADAVDGPLKETETP